jgi:hypothetical protein
MSEPETEAPLFYEVLVGTGDEIDRLVSEAITQGWTPCGGVAVVWRQWENARKGYMESETMFYQAVWRQP